ncbi:hypothetical protein BW14_07000 [Bifidobacterium sp. UTBIF-68]|uniref:hypothetical protein n=1 Tax=Bifidobacterium sp. UTBIF-68 TaxID=1465262 RepID=UPI00112E4DB1|nr:hypothetical protein [Bifidobacterium sp. UTBIF-68]TPF92904.1 hypothetical protein BW14_07000 [Bifidobacterium sp. UTBIF-68]
MSATFDDKPSDERESSELEQRVREALSTVLAAKSYVVIVDRTTLDDLKDDSWRLGVYTPEYQSPITTCGLLALAQDTCHVPLEADDGTEE